jgi:hypothetical protein
VNAVIAHPPRLRTGDTVRVRTVEQIRATLDDNGCLDGLPFMPEMLKYCGQRSRVRKRAHKTCDTLYGLGGLRVLVPAVHLDDQRCDGSAHGGCQASCLLFWHEAWLDYVPARRGEVTVALPRGKLAPPLASLPESWSVNTVGEDPIYKCQATWAPAFTTALSAKNVRQYAEDLSSGNVSLRELFWGGFHALFRKLMHIGVGYRYIVATYNWVQARRGAPPNPYVAGKLTKTPVEVLDLKIGDWVRIKPFNEIMATLNERNRNRGLWFVPEEMGQFCGQVARVSRRVDRLLDEKTGKMLVTKTPAVVLDGVYCTGTAVEKRLNCPRAAALFWREIWLERVAADDAPPQPAPCCEGKED